MKNLYKTYCLYYKLFISISALLFYISITAQVVNTGQITIESGTIVSVVPDFDNKESGALINDGDLYIYSDFNNNGLISFLTKGLTRFQGNKAQQITGKEDSFFYDVLFDNASTQPAFQLAGGISIANQGVFSKGIVNNDDYGGSISFEHAGIAMSPSNESHVDGTVTKRGSTSFKFPIGDSGFYRHGGISAPNDVTDVYTGKYYLKNSDSYHSHNRKQERINTINYKEYWIIEKKEDTEQAQYVTLSWDYATTPPEICYVPEEMSIVRWDEKEGKWKNEGGYVNTSNNTITTVTEAYGVYTLANMDMLNTCKVDIYNAVTPNDDGLNEFFKIDIGGGNTCYNRIRVKIFNRWGVEVFHSDNYGFEGEKFNGYSGGRATINKSKRLPVGTYFYVLTLEFTNENGQPQFDKKAGYLYLNY